jgi:hypothetical protein
VRSRTKRAPSEDLEGVLDNFDAARRKNFIHGLVEMDATEIRRSLRHLEAEGKDICFSAVVMHAVARAADEDASCTPIAAVTS